MNRAGPGFFNRVSQCGQNWLDEQSQGGVDNHFGAMISKEGCPISLAHLVNQPAHESIDPHFDDSDGNRKQQPSHNDGQERPRIKSDEAPSGGGGMDGVSAGKELTRLSSHEKRRFSISTHMGV